MVGVVGRIRCCGEKRRLKRYKVSEVSIPCPTSWHTICFSLCSNS